MSTNWRLSESGFKGNGIIFMLPENKKPLKSPLYKADSSGLP